MFAQILTTSTAMENNTDHKHAQENVFYRIYHSPIFERFMLGIVLLASIIVGLETSPTLEKEYGTWLHLLDKIILAAFITELILGIGSYGKAPLNFFKDGWNIFDTMIVIACALPYILPENAMHAHFFAVLRLVRVLRILKLAEQLQELQIIINALFNSLPSLFYVFLLIVMYFYIYAVIGTDFFREDCEDFESILSALLTLFRIVTFDDWAVLMKDLMKRHSAIGVAFYFVSFILFGAMIFLNLFIGIITSELAELRKARADAELKKHIKTFAGATDEEIRTIEAELAKQLMQTQLMQMQLAQLRAKLHYESSAASETERQESHYQKV
ncbi:MAG: ion transporter [Candidatus Thermochlorobacter sp.]